MAVSLVDERRCMSGPRPVGRGSSQHEGFFCRLISGRRCAIVSEVNSDSGLLADRELDEAIGLTSAIRVA